MMFSIERIYLLRILIFSLLAFICITFSVKEIGAKIEKLKSMSIITGTVTSMTLTEEIMPKVTIEYHVPGANKLRTYTSESFLVYLSFSAGQPIQLLYNPSYPLTVEVYFASLFFLADIFILCLGLFLFGCAAYIVTTTYLDFRATQQTLQNGKKITATYEGITPVASSPPFQSYKRFKLRARWVDPKTKKKYVFHSKKLIFNPAPFMKSNQKIIVLINPNSPDKGSIMDTSFLPKTIYEIA